MPVCPQELEQQGFIHTKGCVGQFEKWLQDNLIVVAGVFVGIALLQVPLWPCTTSRCPGQSALPVAPPSPALCLPDLWHLPGPEPRQRHQSSEGQLVRLPRWPWPLAWLTQGPSTLPIMGKAAGGVSAWS